MIIKMYPTVMYGDKTYEPKEIRNMVNQLVSVFVKSNTDRVVLVLQNRLYALCSMIAALRCKVCFIPVDCNWPPERIEGVLREHENALIVTEEKYYKKLIVRKDNVLNLDSETVTNSIIICDSVRNSPNEIAYIIYTSGSTGRPKGVMIRYISLENYIEVFDNALYRKVSCFFSLLNPSFDFFITEAVIPAVLGKKIYLATDEEIANPRKTASAIKKSGAEILQIVPSVLLRMITIERSLEFLNDLKIICLGGETFSEDLLKKLQGETRAEIYNLYGPTEGTVFTTIANLTDAKTVHIGKPISGVHIKLVNEKGAEIVHEGELVIEGINVAQGYHNNIEATKRSFSVNDSGERVYRTGDYCRYTDDGNLQFIGRIDRQIKSLGNRIELDEIERSIENVPGVEDGAVFAVNNNRRIIGLFTGDKTSVELVKKCLAEHLPNCMVPNEIYKVTSLPTNLNGKKDYNKMKALYEKKNITVEEYNWIVDLCKEKISDQIQDIDEKWSNIYRVESLAYIELIVETEQKFGFQFPDNVLSRDKIDSIKQLIDLISDLKK